MKKLTFEEMVLQLVDFRNPRFQQALKRHIDHNPEAFRDAPTFIEYLKEQKLI